VSQEDDRRTAKNNALKRRWSKLLRDIRDEAKARGMEDPRFYFEGDSGLYVTDGEVYSDDGTRTFAENHPDAIWLWWPSDINADAGGW
jgi:hypothetical protein